MSKKKVNSLMSEYGSLSKAELRYEERMNRISKLLLKFNVGAEVYGTYVEGVVRKPHRKTYRVEFNEDTWRFVYPLLKELVRYRRIAYLIKD